MVRTTVLAACKWCSLFPNLSFMMISHGIKDPFTPCGVRRPTWDKTEPGWCRRSAYTLGFHIMLLITGQTPYLPAMAVSRRWWFNDDGPAFSALTSFRSSNLPFDDGLPVIQQCPYWNHWDVNHDDYHSYFFTLSQINCFSFSHLMDWGNHGNRMATSVDYMADHYYLL